MNKLQKVLAVMGIIVFVFIPLWLGIMIPFMERVSEEHEVFFSYMARSRFAESIGDSLIEKSFMEHHHERVAGKEGDILIVEMKTEFVEITTGQLQYQVTNQIRMNRESRLIEGKELFLFFPRQLEKKNYQLRRFSYFPEEGALFTFKGEEGINGINCYRFSFQVSNLDWTNDYPHIVLEQGVSIKAKDWGNVWVEPQTGIIVKHEEKWEAVISGGRYDGYPVDIGEMWFLPDSIIRQVFLAGNERRRLIFYKKVAPAVMFLIAAILLFMAWPGREESQK